MVILSDKNFRMRCQRYETFLKRCIIRSLVESEFLCYELGYVKIYEGESIPRSCEKVELSFVKLSPVEVLSLIRNPNDGKYVVELSEETDPEFCTVEKRVIGIGDSIDEALDRGLLNITTAQFRSLIYDIGFILNGDESVRERAKERVRYIRNIARAIGYLRSAARTENHA